jgi:hypothetical protein
MSHPHEDELVLHYYGELVGPDAGLLERHLRECAACRESFARLERVLRAIEQAPVQEPADGFEGEIWSRLRPGLRAAGKPGASAFGIRHRTSDVRHSAVGVGHSGLIPRWVFASGVAALVVIAFLAGALWRATRSVPQEGSTQAQNAVVPGAAPRANTPATGELRERLLLAAVGEHLDRTEVVLVELMNAQGRGTVDITAEQLRAEDLASENRLYRQTAQSLGNQAVVSLLDELDLILTEVVGGPSALAAADLESMQNRIERGNLLFKVQVTASELRERQRADIARRMRLTS